MGTTGRRRQTTESFGPGKKRQGGRPRESEGIPPGFLFPKGALRYMSCFLKNTIVLMYTLQNTQIKDPSHQRFSFKDIFGYHQIV
jgi:hypothetical protein